MLLPCPSCKHPLRLAYQHLGLKGNCISCGAGIMGAETSPGKFEAVFTPPRPPGNEPVTPEAEVISPKNEETPGRSAHSIPPNSGNENPVFPDPSATAPSVTPSPFGPNPPHSPPIPQDVKTSESAAAPSPWGFSEAIAKKEHPEHDTTTPPQQTEEPPASPAPAVDVQGPFHQKQDQPNQFAHPATPFMAPTSPEGGSTEKTELNKAAPEPASPFQGEKTPPESQASSPFTNSDQSNSLPVTESPFSTGEDTAPAATPSEIGAAKPPFIPVNNSVGTAVSESTAQSPFSPDQFSADAEPTPEPSPAVSPQPVMKTPFDFDVSEGETSTDTLKNFLTDDTPVATKSLEKILFEPDQDLPEDSPGDSEEPGTAPDNEPEPVILSDIKLKSSVSSRSRRGTIGIFTILFAISLFFGFAMFVWTPPAKKKQIRIQLSEWLAPGTVLLEKLPFGPKPDSADSSKNPEPAQMPLQRATHATASPALP